MQLIIADLHDSKKKTLSIKEKNDKLKLLLENNIDINDILNNSIEDIQEKEAEEGINKNGQTFKQI